MSLAPVAAPSAGSGADNGTGASATVLVPFEPPPFSPVWPGLPNRCPLSPPVSGWAERPPTGDASAARKEPAWKPSGTAAEVVSALVRSLAAATAR